MRWLWARRWAPLLGRAGREPARPVRDSNGPTQTARDASGHAYGGRASPLHSERACLIYTMSRDVRAAIADAQIEALVTRLRRR